jgi:hypothetical protein
LIDGSVSSDQQLIPFLKAPFRPHEADGVPFCCRLKKRAEVLIQLPPLPSTLTVRPGRLRRAIGAGSGV